jgi:hypothetical protein
MNKKTLNPNKLKIFINAVKAFGGSKGDRNDFYKIVKLLSSNQLAKAADAITLLDTSPTEWMYEKMMEIYPELWDMLFDNKEGDYIALARPKAGLPENKMNKELLRMQMLAGIITESQYNAKINEDDMSDKIPLTPEIKAYIDDAIQSAKNDGELEYLLDVGFFDTDIIDNILIEFEDEFPNAIDLSQEAKDYMDSQL